MKVTPDSDAPIMPYATIGHDIFLSPTKKLSVLALLEVKNAIENSINVYRTKIMSIRVADMICGVNLLLIRVLCALQNHIDC